MSILSFFINFVDTDSRPCCCYLGFESDVELDEKCVCVSSSLLCIYILYHLCLLLFNGVIRSVLSSAWSYCCLSLSPYLIKRWSRYIYPYGAISRNLYLTARGYQNIFLAPIKSNPIIIKTQLTSCCTNILYTPYIFCDLNYAQAKKGPNCQCPLGATRW